MRTQTKTKTRTKTAIYLAAAAGMAAAALAVSQLYKAPSQTGATIGGSSGTPVCTTQRWTDWGSKPAGYAKRPVPDLDAWLNKYENYGIMSQILWWNDQALMLTDVYKDWPAEMKKELSDEFAASWNWYESGAPPEVLGAPPESAFLKVCTTDKCMTADKSGINVRYISISDARKIYVKSVADALAAELGGWFPWSLRQSFSKEQIRDFFDPTRRFGFWPTTSIKSSALQAPLSAIDFQGDSAGMLINGRWVIADVRPRAMLGFLKNNQLIGKTRRGSVNAMLGWSKRLQHFSGWPDMLNVYRYWQSYGAVPLSRVVGGTVSQNPVDQQYTPGVQNWTAGCQGSHFLYSEILASQLVPTERTTVCGHSLTVFPTEGLMLSHDDDPYDQTVKTSKSCPEELPVTKDYFEKFVSGKCEGVSRKVAELDVKYISGYTLGMYCQDLVNKKAKQDGRVFEYLKRYFTMAELDAAGLWNRLEQRKAQCPMQPVMPGLHVEPLILPDIFGK